MMAPRLPGVSDRTMVIGATGEGKTVGGLYILSYQPFHEMPWVIIDYKRDKLISAIEDAGAEVIFDNRKDEGKEYPEPPTEPGLYIIRPDPDHKEQVNTFLQAIWRNGNTGLFCDEAFMIPQKRPFKAYDNLLTQGRSLNCPMIMLYQRPVDMSQYATSQAEFWMVYNLRKPEDIEKAGEYVGAAKGPAGKSITVKTKLPRYYWLWYDVSEDNCEIMSPVPAPETVLAVFYDRLEPPPEQGTPQLEAPATPLLEGPKEERPGFRLI